MNLNCNFCQENFDCIKKTPRMIFQCGHSICSLCLENFLSKNQKFFICPKDYKKILLTNLTLENFPKNYSLIMILENKEVKVLSKKSFRTEKKNLNYLTKKKNP